jgi:hypothetical protein
MGKGLISRALEGYKDDSTLWHPRRINTNKPTNTIGTWAPHGGNNISLTHCTNTIDAGPKPKYFLSHEVAKANTLLFSIMQSAGTDIINVNPGNWGLMQQLANQHAEHSQPPATEVMYKCGHTKWLPTTMLDASNNVATCDICDPSAIGVKREWRLHQRTIFEIKKMQPQWKEIGKATTLASDFAPLINRGQIFNNLALEFQTPLSRDFNKNFDGSSRPMEALKVEHGDGKYEKIAVGKRTIKYAVKNHMYHLEVMNGRDRHGTLKHSITAIKPGDTSLELEAAHRVKSLFISHGNTKLYVVTTGLSTDIKLKDCPEVVQIILRYSDALAIKMENNKVIVGLPRTGRQLAYSRCVIASQMPTAIVVNTTWWPCRIYNTLQNMYRWNRQAAACILEYGPQGFNANGQRAPYCPDWEGFNKYAGINDIYGADEAVYDDKDGPIILQVSNDKQPLLRLANNQNTINWRIGTSKQEIEDITPKVNNKMTIQKPLIVTYHNIKFENRMDHVMYWAKISQYIGSKNEITHPIKFKLESNVQEEKNLRNLVQNGEHLIYE